MDRRQSFVAHAQAPELMQPRDGSLDHPPGFAQATAMLGIATGDLGLNAALSENLAQAIGVIAAVGLDEFGLALGSAALARDRRNGVEQGQQLSDIVTVCFGEYYRKWDTLRIREEVVFAARTTAIGWVRSTFFPAPTARMEELSATAREKSSCFAPRSSESSTRCSRLHTPRRCQCFRRRQQVIPEPQPISLGSISHGMPERSTNRMPVSTRRSSSGRRPVCRLRLRFFGNNGSMRAHNSSSINGFGIRAPLEHAMPHRTKTVINVQASFC